MDDGRRAHGRIRIADVLRLVRAPLAPTAATDAIACALLARSPGLSAGAAPLSVIDVLWLAATAMLVYVAGMAGNDLFDRTRDRTLHPERPIPSGKISAAAAAVLALLAAAGAVAIGGGPAGHRVAVVLALALALLYDAYAKDRLGIGCFAMGGVRAMNAVVGVAPLLLAGTTSPWALAAPFLLGLYSAGVTAHSTSEDRPQPYERRLLFARAAAFSAFAGAGILSLVGAGGVTLGAFVAPGFCLSIVFARVPRKAPVKAQVLELLLGLFWLDWILSTGGFPGSRWPEALGGFALAFGLIVSSQLAIRGLRPRT